MWCLILTFAVAKLKVADFLKTNEFTSSHSFTMSKKFIGSKYAHSDVLSKVADFVCFVWHFRDEKKK